MKNSVGAFLMDIETVGEHLSQEHVNKEELTEGMAEEIQRLRLYVIHYQEDFTLEELQRVNILLDLAQKSLDKILRPE